MTNAQIILFGCLGGLLPDVIRLVKNRHTTELPEYLKTPHFYIGLVLLIGLGGLAARLMQPADTLHAILYGYTAPELLTRLAANVSEQGVARAIKVAHPTTAGGFVSAMSKWWSTA